MSCPTSSPTCNAKNSNTIFFFNLLLSVKQEIKERRTKKTTEFTLLLRRFILTLARQLQNDLGALVSHGLVE